MIGRVLSCAAVLALSGLAACAATINFDTLPDAGAMLDSYSENGITATAIGGALAWSGVSGYAHIDDSGTGLASGLDITVGGLFDAVEFSLISLGYNFFDPPEPFADNIIVTGFQGGSVASTASFLLSDIAGTVQTFLLGPGFSGLDRLRIELLYPQTIAFCDAPCGHFDLDYVTVNPAPVPLPASGVMLIAGGLGLMALRRRQA